MHLSKGSGLAVSLGFSFSLSIFRSLFPFPPSVLIERVCMVGTERKKEIDNDTRLYCVENPLTYQICHTHTQHTLSLFPIVRCLFHINTQRKTCAPLYSVPPFFLIINILVHIYICMLHAFTIHIDQFMSFMTPRRRVDLQSHTGTDSHILLKVCLMILNLPLIIHMKSQIFSLKLCVWCVLGCMCMCLFIYLFIYYKYQHKQSLCTCNWAAANKKTRAQILTHFHIFVT